MLIRILSRALLAYLLLGNTAEAQDNYPTKPIRMIVPFAVGGTNDILARLLSVKMTEALEPKFEGLIF